ncbi:MAG TPA: ferritin-like domain-containing protein [Candidatus Dormibacteraeota bacterium]|nr:ferritin-like domain-containing protein [Candidatus Dormibacteraeota bacterium]
MSNRENSMDLSERELLAMTRELDQMHGDLFPRFRAALADVTDGWREHVEGERAIVRLSSTRRNFLRGGLVTAGALGGGAVLAACGGSNAPAANAGASASSGATSQSVDLTVARLAASLEVLAVNTYQTVLDAAGKGALGTVPPAVATFVTTAKMQHTDHASAWNSALTGAGLAAQTAPDPHYNKVVQGALPTVKTVVDAARLALTLETVAVETYTAGSGLVTDKKNRLVALTIAPVEAQHVAILHYVLGQYPVPDSFIKTDMAASPSDLTEAS